MSHRPANPEGRARLVRIDDATWRRILELRPMLRTLGNAGRLGGAETFAAVVEVAHRELSRRCRDRGKEPTSMFVPTHLGARVPRDPVAFEKRQRKRASRVQPPPPPRRLAFQQQRARADARAIRDSTADQSWRELPPA